MKNICFIDAEIKGNIGEKLWLDKIGYYNPITKKEIKNNSLQSLIDSIDDDNPEFICGHNIIDFDSKMLPIVNDGHKNLVNSTSQNIKIAEIFTKIPLIDTLYLSLLLYPSLITHRLEKPYITDICIENDPLEDSLLAFGLFDKLDSDFDVLPIEKREIFYKILSKNKFFSGYFLYKNMVFNDIEIYKFIKIECEKTNVLFVIDKDKFDDILYNYPLETAFCTSLLLSGKKSVFSSFLLFNYPKIVEIYKLICYKKPDKEEIRNFCRTNFKIENFDFKEFDKKDKSLFDDFKISQFDIIDAAFDDKDFIAILPTGAGKTLCFQAPALYKAKTYKALTIVVSPLVALMQNHIESLKSKVEDEFFVATLSGQSAASRVEILNEIKNGTIDLLYISPESLRSNTLFGVICARLIDRFVIDEAHCMSSWGHDFRQDYFFLADTIKELRKNEFNKHIKVSCFSATAKKEVLDEIKYYFNTKLDSKLDEFVATSLRSNLDYFAYFVENEEEKYKKLKEVLKKEPTIIYLPQNAKGARELCEKLKNENKFINYRIEPFYANIDAEIKNNKRTGRDKDEILRDFICDDIDIIIATTAFGMGIDKSNIKNVIHYEQSANLESYLQESGRGARDEKIRASCIAIYSLDDFDKQFNMLNRTKIKFEQIKDVSDFIKNQNSNEIFVSPKEIEKIMGVENEDNGDIAVKTAILELEKANMIERKRDNVRIFANSSNFKINEAIEEIDKNSTIENKVFAKSVVHSLAGRSKKEPILLSDLAGLIGAKESEMESVLITLNKLNIIDFKNSIEIEVKNDIKSKFEKILQAQDELLKEMGDFIEQNRIVFSIKKNNKLRKNILKSFKSLAQLDQKITFETSFYRDNCDIKIDKFEHFKNIIEMRIRIWKFIISNIDENAKDIELDLGDLQNKIFANKLTSKTKNIFYNSITSLSDLLKESLVLKNGRLIYLKKYKIKKLITKDKNWQYTKTQDYEKLKRFYELKVDALHIQKRFLDILKDGNKLVINDFIGDYFSLKYEEFLKKYKFNIKELKIPMTPEKYKEILKSLNNEQKQVFDSTNKKIMVLAGPGSGKTKTLVHKMAASIMRDGVKSEHFLMLTFSKSAVVEFRNRIKKLIGANANGIKIKTFHSFALDLLDTNINSEINGEELTNINSIQKTTAALKNSSINLDYVETLMLDEFQDIGEYSYEFIKEIYKKMSGEKKIIAVCDDDQCIKNFGNDMSKVAFIKDFSDNFGKFDTDEEYKEPTKFCLNTNYRSCKKIVQFCNDFTNEFLKNRLKIDPLISYKKDEGEVKVFDFRDDLPNLVDFIKEDIVLKKDSIAVLVRSNKDAMLMQSNLKENGIIAKALLDDDDSFKFGYIDEFIFFKNELEKNDFDIAFDNFNKEFYQTPNYEMVKTALLFFKSYNEEIINNKELIFIKFEQFLDDATMGEYKTEQKGVIVSTIHKAKGREFDSVYLIKNFDILKDEYEKRLFYVGISRAKSRLYIFSNLKVSSDLLTSKSSCESISQNKIQFFMGIGDLYISLEGAKENIQKLGLRAGDTLNVKKDSNKIKFFANNTFLVAQLSKPENGKDRLSETIIKYENRNFKLIEKAKIKYLLWYKDKNDKWQILPLCVVEMKK